MEQPGSMPEHALNHSGEVSEVPAGKPETAATLNSCNILNSQEGDEACGVISFELLRGSRSLPMSPASPSRKISSGAFCWSRFARAAGSASPGPSSPSRRTDPAQRVLVLYVSGNLALTNKRGQ